MRRLLILVLLMSVAAHAGPRKIEPIHSFYPSNFDTLLLSVSFEWVTVKVDSLNLGEGGEVGCQTGLTACPDGLPGCMVAHFKSFHDWTYGPTKDFKWMADFPYDPPKTGGPTPGYDADYFKVIGPYRERICKACLRHEWQKRQEIPTPPSEFDVLKGRLK